MPEEKIVEPGKSGSDAYTPNPDRAFLVYLNPPYVITKVKLNHLVLTDDSILIGNEHIDISLSDVLSDKQLWQEILSRGLSGCKPNALSIHGALNSLSLEKQPAVYKDFTEIPYANIVALKKRGLFDPSLEMLYTSKGGHERLKFAVFSYAKSNPQGTKKLYRLIQSILDERSKLNGTPPTTSKQASE